MVQSFLNPKRKSRLWRLVCLVRSVFVSAILMRYKNHSKCFSLDAIWKKNKFTHRLPLLFPSQCSPDSDITWLLRRRSHSLHTTALKYIICLAFSIWTRAQNEQTLNNTENFSQNEQQNKVEQRRDETRVGQNPWCPCDYCVVLSTEKESVCREEVRLLSTTAQGKNMDQTILCTCILSIYYENVQPSALTRCLWIDYIDGYLCIEVHKDINKDSFKAFFVFLHAQHICQYNLNP